MTLRTSAPLLATGFALLWSLGHLSATAPVEPSFELVLARFNTVAPPAYRAFRRLEAGNPGSKKFASMDAWTEYQPGRGFTFEVVREEGSEFIRNRVLRGILTSEQDLITRGKPLRAGLEAKNYIFDEGGTTDGGLRRIVLKAARKSDGIVNGSLFMEPESGDLVGIEGRLVKSPSFWVRDVDVIWKYGRVGGQLVPMEMSTIGRVRLYGRATFRMVYEYASIDGQPISGGLKATRNDQPRR
jgi:hypothetical protein